MLCAIVPFRSKILQASSQVRTRLSPQMPFTCLSSSSLPGALSSSALAVSFRFVSAIFSSHYLLTLHVILAVVHLSCLLYSSASHPPRCSCHLRILHQSALPPPLHLLLLSQELVWSLQWSAQGTTKRRGNSKPVVPSILISPLVLQSSPTELQHTANKPRGQQDMVCCKTREKIHRSRRNRKLIVIYPREWI